MDSASRIACSRAVLSTAGTLPYTPISQILTSPPVILMRIFEVVTGSNVDPMYACWVGLLYGSLLKIILSASFTSFRTWSHSPQFSPSQYSTVYSWILVV